VVHRKRNRVDLYKNITPDYYGFRDDEDGILVDKEMKREKELVAIARREYEATKKKYKEDILRSGGVYGQTEYDEMIRAEEEEDDDIVVMQEMAPRRNEDTTTGSAQGEGGLGLVGGVGAIGVPSRESIEQFMVEQKKQSLLESYL
jgi:pre-mRNA-splicing factor ISY1